MSASTSPIEQVLTFGLEEEFVLADVRTRVTVPRAAEVLEKAAVQLGERAQHEFFETQVEFTTRPRMTAEALRSDLTQSRQVGAAAAAGSGSLLVGAATAVLTDFPPPVTEDARYAVMADRFAGVLRRIDSETSGCHVHVGTLQRDEALALGNRLRPWLPTLQAVCVNSPFAAGRDRGCASQRHFEYRHWPTTGPAPALDMPGYERLVGSLLEAGTILDRKMVYWYGRPSEHCPTLELRVADVNADIDVVMLYAVLVRGLATTLLAEVRQGLPAPEVSQAALYLAHEEVALGGLSGTMTDPVTGRRTPVVEALAALLARARPGLAAAGDVETAERLVTRLRARGTGADRQREAYRRRGRLQDVVDALAVRVR